MVSKKGVLNEVQASNAFRRVAKWHIAGICCLAVTFLVSSAVCLCLSYVNYALYPDCILYSKWTCTSRLDIDKPLLTVQQATVWGKKSDCNLTQYGLAGAAVASFILCWFFVFFRPTKDAYFFKKKTAASKLILPSVIICLTFTITVFVATITLQQGFSSWCDNFGTSCRKNESCSNVMNYKVVLSSRQIAKGHGDSIQQEELNYYVFLIAALAFSWMASFVWLGNLILLIVRCYLHLDFPTYFFQRDDSPQYNNNVQTETDSD